MMALALFFVETPDGGFVGKCETFPGWRYIASDRTRSSMNAAEESLRAYIAGETCFCRYIVPEANRTIAQAA